MEELDIEKSKYLDNEKENFISYIPIIILLVVVFLIVGWYFLFQNKLRRLVELEQKIERRKNYIYVVEKIKKRLDIVFKISYSIVKLIYTIIFAIPFFLVYKLSNNNSILEYFGNCLNTIGSVSGIIFYICFIMDAKPFEIFNFRDNIRQLLVRKIYGRHNNRIKNLSNVVVETTNLNKEYDQLNE